MKKIRFLTRVNDKNTEAEYKAGDIVEFEDERANEILSQRMSDGSAYAEEVIEQPEEEKEQPKETKKANKKEIKKGNE